MQNRTFLRPARCATLLVASCFAALAAAQNPPSNPPQQADNDAWLAQTAKLYYSSAKAGLQSFDCAVHPDWRALYATENGGSLTPDNAQRVALLNSVSLTLHGRMKGGSTMDWNPPAQQFNTDQTNLLNKMHDAFNETLVQGFMQFWTPFVESSVVPDNSSGMEITTTDDGGRKIHLKTTEIELWETFDSGRILRQYNIVMSGTKIDLTPTYSPSDHGLLITHFHASIEPLNDPKTIQEMNVEIAYQWIDGFPIPAHLDMEVTGVATLHMTFDGCTVQR